MNVLRLSPIPLIALVCCLSFGVVPVRSADRRQAWTDTGAGFASGTLGNSGQNLYVNRRGELETIHRYDIDGNGYLDLIFNDTHDAYFALPVTLAKAGPGHSLQLSELPVEGSSGVIPCDLNGDGFVDLIFLPNSSNVQLDAVNRATQT